MASVTPVDISSVIYYLLYYYTMSYWEVFNHATHKALFDSGRREEAEAYRLKFIKNKEKVEEVKKEESKEENALKSGLPDNLDKLNEMYYKEYGRKLVGKYRKSAERIKSKLSV